MRSLKKVLSISALKLEIQNTVPPTLKIIAGGEAPAVSWRNAQLVPYSYIIPPKDGIYRFDLVAEEPGWPVPEMVSPMKTEFTWEDFPLRLKGVRVFASINDIQRELTPAVAKMAY